MYHLEIYFKELASLVVESGLIKYQRCRSAEAWKSKTGADKAVHRQNFFLLRETSVLILRPINGLDEAHPDYYDNLYLKSTDCRYCQLYLQSTFTATPRLAFDWTTGNHSLAKSTHKTKKHYYTIPLDLVHSRHPHFFLPSVPTSHSRFSHYALCQLVLLPPVPAQARIYPTPS